MRQCRFTLAQSPRRPADEDAGVHVAPQTSGVGGEEEEGFEVEGSKPAVSQKWGSAETADDAERCNPHSDHRGAQGCELTLGYSRPPGGRRLYYRIKVSKRRKSESRWIENRILPAE